MPQWSLAYQPNEKQKIFHAVKARQILYGGSAGGGKSHAIRMDLNKQLIVTNNKPKEPFLFCL